jgi:hypothetical protein
MQDAAWLGIGGRGGGGRNGTYLYFLPLLSYLCFLPWHEGEVWTILGERWSEEAAYIRQNVWRKGRAADDVKLDTRGRSWARHTHTHTHVAGTNGTVHCTLFPKIR